MNPERWQQVSEVLDQALRLRAIREIERRCKLRRGNPDQACAEPLGKLACDFIQGGYKKL